jgi:DNA-binding MarR family transcriptional regulator
MENATKIFLQKRAPYILLALEQCHTASEVAKKLDTLPFNIYKILNSFDELGLIENKKVGRKCFINLTEKGRKIAEIIKNLCEALK